MQRDTLNLRYMELAGAMVSLNTASRVIGLPEKGGIQIARPELYSFVQLS